MRVRFKLLHPEAVLPSYGKPGDAGMDLTITNISRKDDMLVCSFGISVEIPEGYVGLIFPRSSICGTDLTLSNSVGVVDSGYRGEVKAMFKYTAYGYNHADKGEEVTEYKVGNRAAQMIIMPYPTIEPEVVDELSETIRGLGGFGSTGQN